MINLRRVLFAGLLCIMGYAIHSRKTPHQIVRPALTILSAPIGLPHYGYVGHHAVLRSVCAGLDALGVSYNCNPRSEDEVADIVLVTAHMTALHQAIGLKRRGIVSHVIAGPNLMERPRHYPDVSLDAIDCYLVPSRWVRVLFAADQPALQSTLRIWYAGVDADYWKPNQDSNISSEVLLYCKQVTREFADQVSDVLHAHNWRVHRVVYGTYNHAQLKDLLARVRFAVVLSKSETQGLALAQMWSMNVPTLVWDPQQTYDHGDWYQDISAAPYLTPQTGARWQTLHDLTALVESVNDLITTTKPREWVLQHMTDQKAAQQLCAIIKRVVTGIYTKESSS